MYTQLKFTFRYKKLTPTPTCKPGLILKIDYTGDVKFC